MRSEHRNSDHVSKKPCSSRRSRTALLGPLLLAGSFLLVGCLTAQSDACQARIDVLLKSWLGSVCNDDVWAAILVRPDWPASARLEAEANNAARKAFCEG